MKNLVSNEKLIIGSYNAMRDRLIKTQHENLTLKKILHRVLKTEKRYLEEIIKEMELNNEVQEYKDCY